MINLFRSGFRKRLLNSNATIRDQYIYPGNDRHVFLFACFFPRVWEFWRTLYARRYFEEPCFFLFGILGLLLFYLRRRFLLGNSSLAVYMVQFRNPNGWELIKSRRSGRRRRIAILCFLGLIAHMSARWFSTYSHRDRKKQDLDWCYVGIYSTIALAVSTLVHVPKKRNRLRLQFPRLKIIH